MLINSQPLPDHARKVFSGVLFDVYQWEQTMFDGSARVFEKIVRRQDSVNIIAVTTGGKIILQREEQPGARPFIGTPGGRVDPGEDPLGAAKRELLEETGYEAAPGHWSLWRAEQPASKIDWAVFTFIATGCRPVGKQAHEAGEKIDLMLVDYDKFLNLMDHPEFRDTELAMEVLKLRADPVRLAEFKKLLGIL
jgi:ADP-ribose pyrophosphatase